jgi:outer membrane protein OmpU
VATIFSQGRFNMRKVLLATTALVALNVSAASADISINGTAVFEIYSPSKGAQTYSTDGSIVITGSQTTDTGLTVKAIHDMGFESASTTNDSYIAISGDFGTVNMGKTDGALDRKDGNLAANLDLETTATQNVSSGDTNMASTIIGGDSTNISFFAPSINGLEAYGEIQENGKGSGVGVNYSIAGISLMYQVAQEVSAGGAEFATKTDASAVGASASVAGFKVNAGYATFDAVGSMKKRKSNDIGVSYSMDNITLVATSARGTRGTRTDKYSNIGVSYTIAPGVVAMVESGQSTKNSVNFDATWAALSVSF